MISKFTQQGSLLTANNDGETDDDDHRVKTTVRADGTSRCWSFCKEAQGSGECRVQYQGRVKTIVPT